MDVTALSQRALRRWIDERGPFSTLENVASAHPCVHGLFNW